MDFFFVGTAHLSMQLPIYQPVLQPLLRGHHFLLLSLAVLVMVQQTSPPLCKWMHQEVSQVLTLQLSARIRPQLLSNQIFKLQVRHKLACLCYLTSQFVSVSQEHFFQTFNTEMWCSSHYCHPRSACWSCSRLSNRKSQPPHLDTWSIKTVRKKPRCTLDVWSYNKIGRSYATTCA